MEVTITTLATLVAEIGVLIGVLVPVVVRIRKISNGTKCQLRSEMLRIYYRYVKDGEIHQYEYENFVMLYEAYKALNGNSFIDKIYEEVHSFDIVSWKDGLTMEALKKNLANLIKVKTIVTLVVMVVFAVLALTGKIDPNNAMIIISMVVSFYFGTQAEKKGVN